MKYDYSDPFQYTETIEFDGDISSDHTLFKFQGLAYISTAGCGTDYYLELNGANVGQVWCNWEEEFTKKSCGNFYNFYNKWVVDTEIHLERHQLLKTFNCRF